MEVSIGKKIFIGFSLALAALLLIGFVAYTSTDTFIQTSSLVTETHHIIENLRLLLSHMTDMETGQRGYIITGLPEYLEPYLKARIMIRSDVEGLRGLLSNDPEQSERLQRLEGFIAQRQSLTERGVILREQEGPEAAFDHVMSGAGKFAMDEIRLLVDEMEAHERQKLSARTDATTALATRTKVIAVGGALLTLFIVAVALVIIRRDFERRTQAEQARLEAESRFRSIFENSIEGIYQTTPAGRIINANPALARIVGYDSPAELMSHSLNIADQFYVMSSDREKFKQEMLTVGQVKGYIAQLRRKDGSTVWVSINGRSFKDPRGNTYFEGSVEDITERKTFEEEKSRLANYISLLLQSTGEGIYGIDANGNCTFVNHSAASLLGYRPDELMGQNMHAMIHYAYADRSPFPPERSSIFRAFKDGKSSRVDNEVFWRKDKTSFPVDYQAYPIIDNFVIKGAVVTFSDISERQRLEDELRRTNRELLDQNRRVEEATRLKSEFLANMSHELRTPLNGIIGFAELMADERAGAVSDEHKEFLADILNSARHLLQLINDILDLAKVESGKMEFRPVDVNISKAVGEVRDIVRAIAASKRIEVRVDIEGVETVFTDPGKLKQVLYNYLSNAIKFTPENGHVTVRVRPKGDEFFVIEVQDSGIGIKQEDLARLFAEFQQLDSGVGKKYQGTGLGLALTKRMVEAQGGEVGVESMPGKGSTFFAVLPRAAMCRIDSFASYSSLAPARTDKPGILVVDDDRTVLRLLEAALAPLGHRTVFCPTAESALQAATSAVPAVVVLDLMFPGIDGFAFLRAFRKLPGAAAIPVIVYTNKDVSNFEREFLERETSTILSKEEGTGPLIDCVQKYLPEVTPTAGVSSE